MKLWLDVHGLHARPLIQYVISPWLVNIWTCYGLLHSLIYSVPFPGLSLFLNSNCNASLTTVVFLKLPLTNHQIERQEERVLSSLLLCVVCLYFMHLSMSSRQGEAGHRAGFRHFPKSCCQIPYPRAKMWGQIYRNSPPQEMICGHRHEQLLQHPYSRDSKIIQIPYPRAQAIVQIPALCPALPPRQLDIDRCIYGYVN